MQPRRAGIPFRRRRPVGGWGAPDGQGDTGLYQPLPVVGRSRRRQAGQTGAVQRREQPVAAAVAGEDAPGAVATVPRDGLWLAQTPQMFRYRLLRDALAAATDAAAITDDASAVEAMGHAPMLVEGHPRNLKVTLPQDIRIAEMYLAAP